MTAARATYSLSLHADYGCRHSGACCAAGWPIPIDAGLQSCLDEARATGRLVMPLRDVSASGCEYYEASGGRLCAIHRQLGVTYKPPSCRHFPRVALLDPRGVSITLSHYCPTAAESLFRLDVPVTIVRNPPAFPPGDEYEGLDARHVMPPLLRPGLLWDLEGYSAWEAEAVALLARVDLTPEQALEQLRAVATRVEEWRPGAGPLSDHVGLAFASTVAPASSTGSSHEVSAPAVNRYLAARLFASWVPYRTDRLRDLVADLERTLAVLNEERDSHSELLDAFRATDLRVVHGRC